MLTYADAAVYDQNANPEYLHSRSNSYDINMFVRNFYI